MSISLCACMGIKEGDLYCYCELKRRGMCTKHYEWTQEEKDELHKALSDMFGWDNASTGKGE